MCKQSTHTMGSGPPRTHIQAKKSVSLRAQNHHITKCLAPSLETVNKNLLCVVGYKGHLCEAMGCCFFKLVSEFISKLPRARRGAACEFFVLSSLRVKVNISFSFRFSRNKSHSVLTPKWVHGGG